MCSPEIPKKSLTLLIRSVKKLPDSSGTATSVMSSMTEPPLFSIMICLRRRAYMPVRRNDLNKKLRRITYAAPSKAAPAEQKIFSKKRRFNKKMPSANQPPSPQSWGRKGVSCCTQTAHLASSFLYNKQIFRGAKTASKIFLKTPVI